MKTKDDWINWIDRLNDDELLHLMDKELIMRDVPENLNYRIINAIKSQKHPSKSLQKKSKLSNIFNLNNLFVKYAYTFTLVFIMFITGILLFFLITPQINNNCIVSAIKGNAYYIDKYGKQIRLAKGYKLYESSTIKTDLDSYIQLKINGRQDLFIYEGTQLKINELSKIKYSERTKLLINSGYCRFKLKKLNKDSCFIVETDSISLSVVGTEFTAGVYNKNISNVSVFEGVVKIKLKTGLGDKIARIRNVDPEIADKIESSLNQNVDLSKGQTIQISNNELKEKTTIISNLLEKIENDYNNKESVFSDQMKLSSKQAVNDIDQIIKDIYFKEGKKTTNKTEEQSSIKPEIKSENLNEKNDIKIEKTNENKLIGEWLFNTNASDTSGSDNNAEVNGARLTKDRFGNDNSAYYFDGKSSIKIKNNDMLKDLEKTNLFTISVWIKIERWNNNHFSVIDKYSKNDNFGYEIACNSNSGIYFTNDQSKYFYSNVKPIIDYWYHIVYINDSINKKRVFYINGVKTEEVNDYFKFNTDSDLFIGYGPSGEKEYSIGTIDDLRIYNYALTEIDIQKLYFENNWEDKMKYIKGTKNADLSSINTKRDLNKYNPAGEWLFEGNALDTSIFKNNCEMHNVKLTKDRFGNENSACYFNGKSDILIKKSKILKEIEKTNQFSLSIWINIEKWNRGYFAIADFCLNDGLNNFFLNANVSEGINFINYTSSFFNSDFHTNLGVWYHIIYINDKKNNKKSFYINGKKVKESNSNMYIKSLKYINIGYASSSFIATQPSGYILEKHPILEEYAIGKIDDLRIYDYVLTDEQIKGLYTEGDWN